MMTTETLRRELARLASRLPGDGRYGGPCYGCACEYHCIDCGCALLRAAACGRKTPAKGDRQMTAFLLGAGVGFYAGMLLMALVIASRDGR